MDADHCSTAFWSAITAANADSTVAGVLAGLLIAAAAALLVQSYQGADGHTIALFGSGVPALALSTYLFTVIGGFNYQAKYPVSPTHPKGEVINYQDHVDVLDNLCPQIWSEWVLAIALVFIGTAVLVCGLAWALASYADNLAVKLCAQRMSIDMVERRRGFFIRLNAWLSAAVLTAATTLLISTNIIYLTTVGEIDLYWIVLHQRWYLLFIIYFVGIFFVGRSSYEIFRRTRSALRANEMACAAYPTSGISPDSKPGFQERHEVQLRVGHELLAALWAGLAALLGGYMTSGDAVNQPRNFWVDPEIAIHIVVFYVIGRVAYILIAGSIKLAGPKKDAANIQTEITPDANQDPESIRIQYSVGALPTTAFSVVLLAILATFVVVGLTQGPFLTLPRLYICLFLGGLYPAVILTALSSSVPAADDARSRYEREWTSRVVHSLIGARRHDRPASAHVAGQTHPEKEADKAGVSS